MFFQHSLVINIYPLRNPTCHGYAGNTKDEVSAIEKQLPDVI